MKSIVFNLLKYTIQIGFILFVIALVVGGFSFLVMMAKFAVEGTGI